MIDLTTYTEEELDALRVDVLTEQERRRTLADAPALVEQIAARYADATADQPAEPYAAPTGSHDAYGPGRKVVWTDGHTYRNDSGQWLSHSPEEYPRGWTCLDCPEPEPDPDTGVLPWIAGESVTVGDLRAYEGTVYRCILAHTTQAGWTPPVVPALWTPQS